MADNTPFSQSTTYGYDSGIGYYSSRGDQVVKQLQAQLAEQRRKRKSGEQPNGRAQSPAVQDLLGQTRGGAAYSFGS
jgi:hypothetical protein